MAKINSKTKIQKILNGAFDLMKRQNKSLSQRSLALKMGVSSSYLSKVFRGEKSLSIALLPKLIATLKMDALQAATLQKLVLQDLEQEQISEHTGITILDDKTSPNMADYESLGIREYWLLEEWHILPLLNLIILKDSKGDIEWLSSRLGISESIVKYTLERLTVTGYVRKNADSKYERTNLKLRFPVVQSHESIRKHHRANLKVAHERLLKEPTTLDVQERLFAGLSVAGDSRKIKEAKIILDEALYKAAELLASGEPDEVFQLSTQFFKISR